MVSYPSKYAQRAPAQARLHRWLWDHPGATLAAAAKDLHLSYGSVVVAAHRLRRRPPGLCPECFAPSFHAGVCHACGFEPAAPLDALAHAYAPASSPVHRVQPNGGLGSETDYYALKPKYGARNVAHLVETGSDRFLERCRSMLWEELKGLMLTDGETEALTRFLVKEVREYRAKYPSLAASKGLARALVNLTLLRGTFGGRRNLTPLQEGGE